MNWWNTDWWNGAYIVPESEYGTRAKCMVKGCPEDNALIEHTDLLDEAQQQFLFGWVIQQGIFEFHWLACGHGIGYTGSWIHETRSG